MQLIPRSRQRSVRQQREPASLQEMMEQLFGGADNPFDVMETSLFPSAQAVPDVDVAETEQRKSLDIQVE